jgi:hypothetical protein
MLLLLLQKYVTTIFFVGFMAVSESLGIKILSFFKYLW